MKLDDLEGGMCDANERMKNAPLYYAVVQAKFAPVAAMAKYVADIQDALRLEGFPLFEVNEGTQLRFDFKGSNEAPHPSFENITQWIMTNSERTSGFILGNDYITYHTTDYDTHKPFISALLLGLSKVFEFAKPSLISRLGVRYLDAVLPAQDEKLDQYLVKELYSVDVGLKPLQSLHESAYQTIVEPTNVQGIMVTRVHKMFGPLSFPPDLVPSGLRTLERFTDVQARWHAVIDVDHYSEANFDFNLELIEQQLLFLRGKVKESFHKMVSDFAREKWE